MSVIFRENFSLLSVHYSSVKLWKRKQISQISLLGEQDEGLNFDINS